MQQSLIRVLLTYAMISFFACPLFAAKTNSDGLAKDPITGLTADQAVKLGADKFCDIYEKKTRDDSTYGMCAASLTFAHLRRYVNDRAEVKRTKPQQATIEKARKLCTDIMTAYIHIDDATGGGGTINRDIWSNWMISVETTVG